MSLLDENIEIQISPEVLTELGYIQYYGYWSNFGYNQAPRDNLWKKEWICSKHGFQFSIEIQCEKNKNEWTIKCLPNPDPYLGHFSSRKVSKNDVRTILNVFNERHGSISTMEELGNIETSLIKYLKTKQIYKIR